MIINCIHSKLVAKSIYLSAKFAHINYYTSWPSQSLSEENRLFFRLT